MASANSPFGSLTFTKDIRGPFDRTPVCIANQRSRKTVNANGDSLMSSGISTSEFKTSPLHSSFLQLIIEHNGQNLVKVSHFNKCLFKFVIDLNVVVQRLHLISLEAIVYFLYLSQWRKKKATKTTLLLIIYIYI